MIPYFTSQSFNLGPLEIQTWGFFVALGFLAGLLVSYQRADKKNLDKALLLDLGVVIIIGALIFARIFHVVFYDWSYYLVRPFEILYLWQGGMSVFGGFFGALAATFIYIKIKRINFWTYGDCLIFGLPLGLAVGRLGCFLVHDHPGSLSNFFLAVNFPAGARHDLGLYHVLLGLVILIIFLIFARQEHPPGFYLILFILIYGLARFFLDFLRAWDLSGADIRYFYLTPAQYFSLLLIILGLAFSKKLKTNL